MIGIALDREVVEAGDFLAGTVQWGMDGDQTITQIFVIAEWRTEGRGNRAHGLSRAVRIPVQRGRREGSSPFRLLIPYEGPVSFTGELIQLDWRVRAYVDRKGIDEQATQDFRVVVRVRSGQGRENT